MKFPECAAGLMLLTVLFLGNIRPASAASPDRRDGRRKITIAFYNTETFYDTIRHPLIDDGDFTPAGRHRWGSRKYEAKIRNIARVLDEIDADVAGLCEIENEGVVRDLMLGMRTSYNYIHRQTRDPRGMDLVLLYRGDIFSPERTRQVGGKGVSREFLVVSGRLLGQPVTFVVCHMPSLMNSTSYRISAAKSLRQLLESLSAAEPSRQIILMGDFNAAPDSRLIRRTAGIGAGTAGGSAGMAGGGRNETPGKAWQTYGRNTPADSTLLLTPFTTLSRQGYGSYIYRDKRQVYDYICLSPGLFTGNFLFDDAGSTSAHDAGTPADAPPALRFAGEYGIFVRHYMIRGEGPKSGYPIRTIDAGAYTGGFSDHLPVFLRLE